MWVDAYIIYSLVCAVGFGLKYRRDKPEWIVRWITAAFFPVVGLLLPPIWTSKRNVQPNSDDDLKFRFEQIERDENLKTEWYDKETAEKEKNLIPLEEALAINDLTTRRKVMIDLLKQDSLQYMDVLQIAVGNEDTETSHYAVSAIVEVKRKLTLTMQEMSVQYEENKNDPHLLRSYADVLKAYMGSGFLDERTMLQLRHTYSEVLHNLIHAAPDHLAAYEEKIEVDLILQRHDAAEETGRLFLEKYPRNEDPYLLLIKVYYSRRSYEQIQAILMQLKESPIRLSNHALNAVRYWSEGGGNEKKAQNSA
ncbi:hypothetical protein ACFPPD_11895 [Cohnella suwonensis]|uniref:Uncharacterized protein n=1 Tax=Cohnella suwonensis TaxID=696072 RepID=A0ABW0LU77_9BACL